MRSSAPSRKRAAGAIAAVVLTALVSAPSVLTAVQAGRPDVSRTPAVPRCATASLVIWLDTQGDGAAGSTYYNLKLTNLAGHACTLDGYPGISAVDVAGRQLGSPASRDKAQAAKRVVVASGGTATSVLRIVEAGNFPASTCRQATAAGLRVYPPGSTASKIVPFPFGACSRSGPVYLTVRPVTA